MAPFHGRLFPPGDTNKSSETNPTTLPGECVCSHHTWDRSLLFALDSISTGRNMERGSMRWVAPRIRVWSWAGPEEAGTGANREGNYYKFIFLSLILDIIFLGFMSERGAPRIRRRTVDVGLCRCSPVIGWRCWMMIFYGKLPTVFTVMRW